MIAHPILINRPIVAGPLGVKLCRPSDVVLDLLPALPAVDLDKEDGAPFLKDAPIAGDDAGLVAALAAEGLPTDDLAEPGRTLFVYRTLSGALDRFWRVRAVRRGCAAALDRRCAGARGRGIGRNLVPL